MRASEGGGWNLKFLKSFAFEMMRVERLNCIAKGFILVQSRQSSIWSPISAIIKVCFVLSSVY